MQALEAALLETAASWEQDGCASGTVRGARTSALEDRDIRELRCHAEGPQVADTVIEAVYEMPNFQLQISRICTAVGTIQTPSYISCTLVL